MFCYTITESTDKTRQDDLCHFILFLPGLVDPSVIVEPLTEEKAARTLYRIELLRKIREQVCNVSLLSKGF